VAVNGTIATNVVLSKANAYAVDSTLTVLDADPVDADLLGNVRLDAQNTSHIEAVVQNTTKSGDTAVGLTLAFNTLGWASQNVLFNTVDALLGTDIGTEQPAEVRAYLRDTTVDADGEVSLSAVSEASITATVGNESTSAAAALYGATGMATSGVLASNKVSSLAQATIDFTGTPGTVEAGGDLTLLAQDQAAIDASTRMIASATTTNDAGASLLNNFVGSLLGEYQYTTRSGEQTLQVGDQVRLADDYAGGGAAGQVYRYKGAAGAPVNLGTQGYAGSPDWELLTTTNVVPTGLNISSSDAIGVGAMIVRNDVRSEVAATIDNAMVTAAEILGQALEQATILATGVSVAEASGGSAFGTGTVVAGNGAAVTNTVLSKANATATDSDLTTTVGGLTLEARNTSQIDATLLSSTTTGDTGVGVVLAFNTVGWATQNLLFNALDALLGTGIGTEQPAEVQAYIADTALSLAGDLTLTAISEAQINATVSNAASSVASALYGAGGKSIGGILASNKVSSFAKAYLASPPTPVVVPGAVTITSSDNAGIYANSKIVSSSITTNDGGASLLGGAVNDVVPADFRSDEGSVSIRFGQQVRLTDDYGAEDYATDAGATDLQPGDLVRLADDYTAATFGSDSGLRLVVTGDTVQLAEDYSADRGVPGGLYKYVGAGSRGLRVELGTEDYTDTSRWAPIGGTAGSVYRYLGAAATLDLDAVDYADTGLWLEIVGNAGSVYEYLGTTATRDLGSVNYGDLGYWKEVPETQLIPQGLNLTPSDSMAIGGLVVLNVVRSDVDAYLQQVTLTAASVTVQAVENAVIRATTDATSESSGGDVFGGGQSLAGNAVVATNVVLGGARAYATDSQLTTTAGDLLIDAQNTAQIDATTRSASTSGATSASFLLAFNTIGWQAQNVLFNTVDALLGDPLISNALGNSDPSGVEAYLWNSQVTAAGAVTITGVSEAQINALVSNDATSAPTAFFGAAGMSASGVLASNMVNSAARAYIDYDPAYVHPAAPAVDVQTTGGLTVTARDRAEIDARTTLYAEVSPTNDAGAGILNQLASTLLDEYQYTSNSGDQLVVFGAKLRVADDYPDADVAGKVYQFMGTDRTLDLGTQDYADFELWKELNPTNLITESTTFTVLSTIGMATKKEGLAGDSQSYYGLIDRNDVRSEVAAFLHDTTVESGGDVVVTALEAATIRALEDSYVVPWEGIGGVIATNVMLSGAEASIRGGGVTTTGGGSVVLDAQNASLIDATTTSKMEAWDAKSLVVAFNSIGWKSQNVLFNALDALMGDPLISNAFGGEQPAEVLAYIEDATIASSGDVRLSAVSQTQLNATVGNENVSEAALDLVFSPTYAAEGVAGGGLLASNKVSSRAAAYIRYTVGSGDVQAAGAVEILAQDTAGINSNSTVLQSAVTSNTAEGLVDIVNALLPDSYQYTTASGERTLEAGDRVRVGSGYDSAKGDAGAVYEYLGSDPAPINLGLENFKSQPVLWTKLVGGADNLEDLYPGIGNFTDSDARAVGILVVMNDVRSAVEAFIDNATLSSASLSVTALETAILQATATSNVTASGGSFYGSGTVLAVNGQVVTNVVLSSAEAYVVNSDITTAGDVLLDASNTSGIDATVLSATDSGDTGVGITLAFNTLGWKSQNFLFNAVDALLGDPLISGAFNGEQPAATLAYLRDTVIDAGGNLTLTAANEAQLNATVSNAAESNASALKGASGKGVGGVLASNKVSSAAEAYIDYSETYVHPAVDVQVDGALEIYARDNAGIYANSKLVASSITTNDGGAAVLQESINDFIPADYVSSEGVRDIRFGERVRLADDYGAADFTTEDGLQTVVANTTRIQLADDYVEPDFTTDSGRRLVVTGDVVQIADDYIGGGSAGGLYKYVAGGGAGLRLDLGSIDYAGSADWVEIGGEGGVVYQYRGGLGGSLELGRQNYADDTHWKKIGGAGAIYQYMGTAASGTGLDLNAQDYTDLGYWKEVLGTSLIPTGYNISDSDAMGLGGLVVLNDVRSNVAAFLRNATAVADTLTITADETAVIRATADSSVTASGGSAFGKGSVIAVNGTIATNLVLSSAQAYITASDVTTAGDLQVDATNVSQIDAKTLSSTTSGDTGVGVTMAFNTIGWQAQNIFFQALDTLLGRTLDDYDYERGSAAGLQEQDRVHTPGGIYWFLGADHRSTQTAADLRTGDWVKIEADHRSDQVQPPPNQEVAEIVGVSRVPPQAPIHHVASIGRIGFEPSQLHVAHRLEGKADGPKQNSRRVQPAPSRVR